jgi:hypothetical protein
VVNRQRLLAFARYGGLSLPLIGFPLIGLAGVVAVALIGFLVVLGQGAGPDLGLFRQLLQPGYLSLQGVDLRVLFLEGVKLALVG